MSVSVVNPAHLHNYIRSLPRRAKTDALDAQLIAQFGEERRPPVWTPPPAIFHEFRQRLQARGALLAARKQFSTLERSGQFKWSVGMFFRAA